MSELVKEELPFEVPLHERMLVRCSKDGETVLTVEQMIYTWRICQYTEPLSYGNYWCFETKEAALGGLWCYLLEVTPEPTGWTKAVTREEDDSWSFRTRRLDAIVEGDDE